MVFHLAFFSNKMLYTLPHLTLLTQSWPQRAANKLDIASCPACGVASCNTCRLHLGMVRSSKWGFQIVEDFGTPGPSTFWHLLLFRKHPDVTKPGEISPKLSHFKPEQNQITSMVLPYPPKNTSLISTNAPHTRQPKKDQKQS